MAVMMALAALKPDNQEAFFATGAALFGVVIFNISLLGILVLTMVVAPGLTQRFSTTLRERNVVSMFVGIPVILGLGLLTVLGGAIHPAIGAVVLAGSVITLFLGLASAAEDVGRRLFWICGKEGSRASHLAVGWLVIGTGSLFPIIGQVVIFPWVALSGLGSIVVGSFRKSPGTGPAADVEFKD